MTIRDAQELKAEADARGLRRALVVTALGLEMDAVRAYLTEPCSVMGSDGAFYECGVFSESGQDWLVVVVETGAGTHPAQSAVQHTHFVMGEFEVQLLVGIAGSRKEDDAPIGSVVASERVYMPYGGKDTDHGRQSRPREFPLDPRLVNLAKKIRRDKAWPDRIRPPLGGRFPETYPVAMPPVGHVAPIASVEVVVVGRKSATEIMLAKDYNDTCVVEMEGFGAVYAAVSVQTPSIIIRGVSDLAMKKSAVTDKARQPVAACHAAAFGFELLAKFGELYLPPARIVQRPAQPAAQEALASAVAAPQIAEVPEPPVANRRVVLNLDLDPASATPEKIAEWQAMLRALTGSEALQVVSTEEGSVRLVVEDPSGALSDLDLEKLREGLEAREGIGLLGRVEEAEYRQLTEVEERLRQASGDLMSWPTTLPDGEWIERPELSALVDAIRGGTRSTTALLGLPGAGKSALLATFSQVIVEQLKWPILAIKADQLPQEVATEEQLAEHLGLPSRPSELIIRLAKLRPVVLVIDQLDALAGHLDLRLGRLNVLMNLVRRLGEVDNVNIVLSSRTFEFEHDVRLKSINAQDIHLELPAWPKVSEILKANGVEADGWPEDAQEVMRSPQALTTYLSLDRVQGYEVFGTYQAMLERLWSERVTAGDRGVARSRLVSELAEEMAARETLWLPRIRYEDRDDDIKALEGAGILTALGGVGSLGFTHQTLFDHALARSFARGVGSLSAYVLERQTSLFLRPKLWAALTYLRGVDPAGYGVELEAIWTTQGLRTHLELLLIDFIGQQAKPTDREVLVMDRALVGPSTRPIALKAIAGSRGWFDRLATGRIADAMTTHPDLTQMILIGAWSHAPDMVERLIEERWIDDPINDGRVWMVLQNAPAWSPATLTLAQTVLGRTSITPHHVDFVVGTLGVDQPTIALELVRKKLDQDLAKAIAESAIIDAEVVPEFESMAERVAWRIGKNPKEPIRRLFDRSNEWDSLPALAEKWPGEFLEILWPWFLDLIRALHDLSADRQGLLGFDLAYDGDFRFETERGMDLPEPAILQALRTAAEGLGSSDPAAFQAWANQQANVDAAMVHRLIAHVMSLDRAVWSKAALAFLLADTRRWYMGSHNDYLGTTARLIEQAAEHWEAAELAQFEAALFAFNPPPPQSYEEPKQRLSWKHTIRRMKLRLFRSLPKARASAAARRTIEEEGRAFGDVRYGAEYSSSSLIGSRMDAAAMAKASDADILNAFKTLPDATNWDHPRDWMSGGNIQLSREFATFAKSESARAFRLMDQFTPEIGTRAGGCAIDALGEDGDPAVIQQCLKSLVDRGFDGEEFRSSVSTGIERLTRRKAAISDETVAILEHWLQHPVTAPKPEGDEPAEGIDTATKPKPETENGAPTRSMLWGYGGISILPGGEYPVLSALLHIQMARKEAGALIETVDAVLARSADPKMWESLLHIVVYFPAGDPDRRPDLINRIFDRAPQLVSTKAGAHLLAYAHWWSEDMARVQLNRPAWQATAASRQTYGELVALVAIVRPTLDWAAAMLAEVLSDAGSEEARAGAALTAVNTWADVKQRRSATDLLAEALTRREPGVWAAVFDLFRLVDELNPDVDTIRVLSAMADYVTSAPPLSATFVVQRLQSLLPHEAQVVAKIALGLVDIWQGELGDLRTSHALAAPELVDLAVTLHRLGPETRDVGTQLFERLITLDAYTARETLDQIDSRFRNNRGPVRPRLQRRRPALRRRRPS